MQHRRGLRLQKLPEHFVVPTARLPLAEGRVIFIRRVSSTGTVNVREARTTGASCVSTVPMAGSACSH
jgi:hypothetical protein